MEIITFQQQPIDTIDPVTEGPAPDFTLNDLHGHPVRLSALKDKTVLISVVPDINTPVCSTQTRFFNEEAARSQDGDIEFLTISNNTSHELANWCAAEGIGMTILPDVDNEFGGKYRLRIFGGPLPGRLARSLYVIRNGNIIHNQIVNEISDEPNYHEALTVARS